MTDNDLMTIGRFARLTGLSAHALRHYDDVGLLVPAVVDASSRYRRYRRDQARTARLISDLRWLDVPVEEIRVFLADPDGPEATEILTRHRVRLVRHQVLLRDRIARIDHLTTKETLVPTTTFTGCAPVQIKLGVTDLDRTVAFYRDSFGMRYDTARRTEDDDYPAFLFGQYGEAGFFLVHLVDSADDVDRPERSTFGLLVDDLDARHAAAVASGGVEVVPPREAEGMPRSSAVKDPSGNWIWLYQG